VTGGGYVSLLGGGQEGAMSLLGGGQEGAMSRLLGDVVQRSLACECLCSTLRPVEAAWSPSWFGFVANMEANQVA
jgi:hypothetical protein